MEEGERKKAVRQNAAQVRTQTANVVFWLKSCVNRIEEFVITLLVCASSCEADGGGFGKGGIVGVSYYLAKF